MNMEQTNDLLKSAINSGRSSMRSEILAKIWALVEEAYKRKDHEATKAFEAAYNAVRAMPIRIEDKPKEMLEEIENDQ